MTVPDTQEIAMRVAARRDVATDVVELELVAAAEGQALPRWEPGAHVELVLDDRTIRHYSLCAVPPREDRWTVAILRVADGRGGSQRVHDELAVGTHVRVRGPRNRFELVPAAHYEFIAGGIGITPLLAMIHSAQARGIPWHLTYGGRSLDSMAYAQDLLDAYGDRVTPWPQDERGLIDLAGIVAGAPAGTAVYACGPEPLLAAIEALAVGATTWSLHVERFVAAEPQDHEGDEPIEVELVDSGVSVVVGPDESILDAVEKAGVFVMSSCREGICGTCETRVLGGRLCHRDSYLTDEERESGEVMMICVSRAVGPLQLEL